MEDIQVILPISNKKKKKFAKKNQEIIQKYEAFIIASKKKLF